MLSLKYPLIAIDKFLDSSPPPPPPQCLPTHIHLSTFECSAFNGHMKVTFQKC